MLVAVLIALTVLALLLVTYAVAPSGVTATAVVPLPAGIVVDTVLVAVLIALTVPEPELAT